MGLTPETPPEQDRLAVLSWLMSLVLFGAAGLTVAPPSPNGFGRPSLRRVELLAVGALTALALLLRVVGLDAIPFPFQGDEASVGTEAGRILAGQVAHLFHTGWSGQPYLSFAPVALFTGVFGLEPFGTRFWSVVEGTASVPLLYLLGRRLYGSRVGLVAAAFLATWPFHIHFSRLAVTNIGDTFFGALVLWLVVRATQERRLLDYAWAGLAAGFTWYSYAGTRLVFGLALLYLGLVAVRNPRWVRGDWMGIAVFGLAIVLSAGPQVLFFADHPDVFMTRAYATSIFRPGYLEQQAESLGGSTILVVWTHFVSSFMVFISAKIAPGMYDATTALLDPLSAGLFLVGLSACTVRLLDPRYFLAAAQFGMVIVFGGALTTESPYVARFVQATPAVALMIGVAFDLLVRTASRIRVPVGRRMSVAVALVLFGAIGLRGVTYYFFDYVPGNSLSARDPNTEVANELGFYLRGLGPSYAVYFVGAPRMTYSTPAIPFLSRNPEGVDLATVTAATVPNVGARQAVFAALPERRPELELIREAYPGGQWREFSRRRPANEPLFYAYEISRGAEP